MIRELREGTGQGIGPEAAPLVVDPHFELYSGIETGQPKPIPLMIVLFDETPAFSSYIAEQDRRCQDLFTPLDASPEGKILSGVPAAEYGSSSWPPPRETPCWTMCSSCRSTNSGA